MGEMKHRFKDNLWAVDQLMPFGRGACGDVYVIWLVDALEPEEAPIVMFGSEGELSVLARHAKECCCLLCLGYSELGLEGHMALGDCFDETQPFRDYMVGLYDIELPSHGADIIKQANQQFAGFKEWVKHHTSA